MTKRANPKPRWRRYEDAQGNWVNERADDKARRRADHVVAVKGQQAAGLESQDRRNRLPVRKKTREIVLPDVTNFGPPRRRPGRMDRERQPARAIYRPDFPPQRNFGPRAQAASRYFKPIYAGASAAWGR